MRVLWDVGSSFSEQSGIWRYREMLALTLAQDKDLSLEVLSPAKEAEESFWLRPFFKAKICWPLFLANHLKKNPLPDIFHGLANINLPLGIKDKKGCKFVITVHDIIPLLPESGCSLLYQSQFRLLLPEILAFADAVVCPSKWTVNLLLARYPWLLPKIFHIANGRADGLKSTPQRSSGQTVKLLAVARHEPYKNLALLFRILAILPGYFHLDLVSDARGLLVLEKYRRELGLEQRVRLFSKVTDETLEQLYSEAALFLHPSLYEGFGLPAIEAFVRGTPVLFVGGHGLSEYLPSSLNFAFEKKAGPALWRDVILAQAELKWQKSYQEAKDVSIKALPSWQDSAFRLKELYNGL